MDQAGQALRSREIGAYATNKGILFELAEQVPGALALPWKAGQVKHLHPNPGHLLTFRT